MRSRDLTGLYALPIQDGTSRSYVFDILAPSSAWGSPPRSRFPSTASRRSTESSTIQVGGPGVPHSMLYDIDKVILPCQGSVKVAQGISGHLGNMGPRARTQRNVIDSLSNSAVNSDSDNSSIVLDDDSVWATPPYLTAAIGDSDKAGLRVDVHRDTTGLSRQQQRTLRRIGLPCVGRLSSAFGTTCTHPCTLHLPGGYQFFSVYRPVAGRHGEEARQYPRTRGRRNNLISACSARCLDH